MDIFGNKNLIQIEVDEWWFNGRIIQKQDHPRLPTWISFKDIDASPNLPEIHQDKMDAKKYCLNNPCTKPDNMGQDYIK